MKFPFYFVFCIVVPIFTCQMNTTTTNIPTTINTISSTPSVTYSSTITTTMPTNIITNQPITSLSLPVNINNCSFANNHSGLKLPFSI